ncbi:hypothetical protein PENSPDRAFT_32514 [Peniophora sp. CONT]|nr:hypothetical protein PENSPDRAFT_32514 [Peniophora sp. CONT]
MHHSQQDIMSGSPSSSSSESSLRIYGPLVPFEDEDDKANLDFGYAPSNRRHARRPSRGLVGLWKDVTRKLRKPERASVLPPGFELIAAQEQRRRSKMLQQIAEHNPRLVAPADRSPSLSISSSSSMESRPHYLEQHQRSASYPGLSNQPRSRAGYASPPRSASLYRAGWA